MRWILRLLLIFALTFNGETLCPHAQTFQNHGQDNGVAATEHVHHDGHASHHASHEDKTHPPSATTDHQPEHCPDDCTGGDHCAGCALLSAAILPDFHFTGTPVPHPDGATLIAYGSQLSLRLEPPPPKPFL